MYAGSRSEVGVSRNDCGEVASKPAPSPAACLRQAGESAAPGNSTAFGWVVWKGGSPAKLLRGTRTSTPGVWAMLPHGVRVRVQFTGPVARSFLAFRTG